MNAAALDLGIGGGNDFAQGAGDAQVEVAEEGSGPDEGELELAADWKGADDGAVEVGIFQDGEDAEFADVEIRGDLGEIGEEGVFALGSAGEGTGGVDARFHDGLLAGAVFVGVNFGAGASAAEGDSLALGVAEAHGLAGEGDGGEGALVEEEHVLGAADGKGCAGAGDVGVVLEAGLFHLIFGAAVGHAEAGLDFVACALGDEELNDAEAVENDGLIGRDLEDDATADAGAEFSAFVEKLADFDGLPGIVFGFAGSDIADDFAHGGLLGASDGGRGESLGLEFGFGVVGGGSSECKSRCDQEESHARESDFCGHLGIIRHIAARRVNIVISGRSW